MPLEPQLNTSGGGLYPSSTQSQPAQPIGSNKLQAVPTGTLVSSRYPGGDLYNGRKVITFGDSITQQGSSEVNGRWLFRSSFDYAVWQANKGYQLLRNAALSGNTSSQMLARLDRDVIAYGPDIVTILAGANELQAGMSNASIALLMNNVKAMCIRLLSQRILPLLITPMPKNGAAAEAIKVQYHFYDLARYLQIPLLDLFRVFVNQTNGQYNASYSDDGLHPNAAGNQLLQPLLAAALANPSAYVAPSYLAAYSEATPNNPGNLLRNGNFARSGTPPTPDGWLINQTNATAQLIAAAAPYTGNRYNFVKALNTPGGYALYSSDITAFAVGDIMEHTGRVSISGISVTAAGGVSVTLESNTGLLWRAVTNGTFTGDMVFYQEAVVPSGITTMIVNIYQTDPVTLDVNNQTVVNRTALRRVWDPTA